MTDFPAFIPGQSGRMKSGLKKYTFSWRLCKRTIMIALHDLLPAGESSGLPQVVSSCFLQKKSIVLSDTEA
jgi:hypothetical protein